MQMFVDTNLALKIEAAEARLTYDTVLSILDSTSGSRAFAYKIGGGVAAFARPGSPMNKVIGVGMSSLISDSELTEIESLYRDRSEAVRVELSTLALADNGRRLTERGYRLLGFENVLGVSLERPLICDNKSIFIEQVFDLQTEKWANTTIAGFSSPDETGIVVDTFTKDVITQAITDTAKAPGYTRYLAFQEEQIVGAASMHFDGKIALLTGATTLAPYRRQGVQGELLKRRLTDAHKHGALLAIITTAGGSRSQANAIRQGFSLLYARAILVLG
jgi:Acetyltransferase (GNAT) domain